jgi:hypothetical protein
LKNYKTRWNAVIQNTLENGNEDTLESGNENTLEDGNMGHAGMR